MTESSFVLSKATVTCIYNTCGISPPPKARLLQLGAMPCAATGIQNNMACCRRQGPCMTAASLLGLTHPDACHKSVCSALQQTPRH